MRASYSIETLQRILNQYKGVGRIRRAKLFTSGFENSNYDVQTDRGHYVVKIFEGQGVTPDTIAFEVAVMDTSWKAEVKTPHVLQNLHGKLLSDLEGKLCIVMDYIAGENMEKRELSDTLVSQAGAGLGKMDYTLAIYRDGARTRQNYEWDLKNFLILEPKIALLPSEFDRNVYFEVVRHFRSVKTTFDPLPKGIIHNDLTLYNMIAEGEKLEGIVDFSDMAFSPFIQNIAVAMCHTTFSYNWKPHQAKLFLAAYEKQNPLTPEALDILYELTLSRYATVVLEFNDWNRRFGEDPQRIEAIRDNDAFLKKFIAIGKENFRALIKS